MGDTISFQMPTQPWAKIENPVDGYVAGYKNALYIRQQNALLAAGQQAAGGDTAGASNTLLGAGSFDDAGKLATSALTLARARNFTDSSNDLLKALQPPIAQAPPAPPAPTEAPATAGQNSLLTGAQPPAPQPGAAPPQAATPPTSADLANLPPAHQAAGHQLLDVFDSAAQTLAGLPYSQRGAWIQQNAPALVAAGIPPAQIASFDPSDQNLAQVHAEAQQARTAMGGTPQPPLAVGGASPPVAGQTATPPVAPTANGGSQAAGAPAPTSPAVVPMGASHEGVSGPPAPSGSYDSPKGQPPVAGQAGTPPRGGFDMQNPRIQNDLVRLALASENPSAGLTSLGSALLPDMDQSRQGYFYDKHDRTGSIVNAVPTDGVMPVVQNGRVVGAAPQPGYADTAAAVTGAVAAGKAAGEAIGALPYAERLARAKAAGEGEGEAPYALESRFGADGSPVTASRSYFLNHPIIGQSPAGKTFSEGQATGLNETIGADQSARQPAMVARDQALRGINIAAQTPFNPAAPAVYEARKIGSIFGLKGPDLDNVAAYQQIANQSLLTFAKGTLPSRYTERELAVAKPIIGSIKDPNSAALFAMGMQAATSNKIIGRAAYADNYNPSSGLTRQQYEAGYAATPTGRQSIFQDPVWQGIEIGGKPAVMPFTYKGRSYLAVTPGLGKPTVIPAN